MKKDAAPMEEQLFLCWLFPPALPAVLLMLALSSEESQFWIAFYDLFFDRQMMYWYYWKKNNKKELSSSIDKFKLEGNKFHCNWCIYQASRQRDVTLHIQSIHEGVKYACNQCDKHYQSKSAVQIHIKSAHKEFRYDGMGHLIASCEESRRCAYPSCKGRARFQCAKCDVGLHPQCFYYYHSYEEMKEIRRSNAAVVVKEDIKV